MSRIERTSNQIALKYLLFCLMASLFISVHGDITTPIPPLPREKFHSCDLSANFGAKPKVQKLQRIISSDNDDICQTVTKTCCSSNDFYLMESNWESNEETISNVEIKTLEMRILTQAVDTVVKYENRLQEMTKLIKDFDDKTKDGQPICVSPAHELNKVLRLRLVPSGASHFKYSSKRCWNYTKSLINGLMCSVCDYDVQKQFDRVKTTITINNEQCLEFTNYCGEHLKSLNAMTYYLSLYHSIMQCTDTAKFIGIDDRINMDPVTVDALNTCTSTKDIDDCIETCKN